MVPVIAIIVAVNASGVNGKHVEFIGMMGKEGKLEENQPTDLTPFSRLSTTRDYALGAGRRGFKSCRSDHNR